MEKKTAVEWLVEQILTEVQNYEDGDIENEWEEPFKHEYVNKYIGMIDLSEFVIKAKEMEKKEKLKHQLFIGKVAEIFGFDKTLELLKECKKELL